MVEDVSDFIEDVSPSDINVRNTKRAVKKRLNINRKIISKNRMGLFDQNIKDLINNLDLILKDKRIYDLKLVYLILGQIDRIDLEMKQTRNRIQRCSNLDSKEQLEEEIIKKEEELNNFLKKVFSNPQEVKAEALKYS